MTVAVHLLLPHRRRGGRRAEGDAAGGRTEGGRRADGGRPRRRARAGATRMQRALFADQCRFHVRMHCKCMAVFHASVIFTLFLEREKCSPRHASSARRDVPRRVSQRAASAVRVFAEPPEACMPLHVRDTAVLTLRVHDRACSLIGKMAQTPCSDPSQDARHALGDQGSWTWGPRGRTACFPGTRHARRGAARDPSHDEQNSEVLLQRTPKEDQGAGRGTRGRGPRHRGCGGRSIEREGARAQGTSTPPLGASERSERENAVERMQAKPQGGCVFQGRAGPTAEARRRREPRGRGSQ